MYTYEFDIYKKELVSDCNLSPTEVTESDTPWLYADNNKYTDVNPDKVGKWMLFLSKCSVNEIWNKIKTAISNGELWHAKVSTSMNEKACYAIMIYTKDYTDLNDVIRVLDYLEVSGIKQSHVTIKYKTDQQTYAGIYSGGRQKPSIYSSNKIREGRGATATRRSDYLSWRNTQATNQPSLSASGPSRPNI